MAVRVSLLFMCRRDLWRSAEGVTNAKQYAIVSGCNVEPRRRRAEFSLLVAFCKFGGLCVVVVADWHVRDSGGLVINRDPQLLTFIVKTASVVFHGRV